MPLRRVLLLALLGLVAVSLGASLATPPAERQEEAAPDPPAPTDEKRGPPPVEISLQAGGRSAKSDRARTRRIEQGTRVVLEVDAPTAGQVAIDELGRVAPVEPETPARFDLLLDQAGSYKVTFAPVGGGPEVVGTLLVETEPSA